MEQELTHLAGALRQIAYEAGCALLGLADPDSVRRCAARYNRVYGRLSELTPAAAGACGLLPERASAGSVRIAARAAAARVEATLACFSIQEVAA